MAHVIADSDVIIDFLRGSSSSDQFDLLLQKGSLGTTAINAFEVLSGAKSKKAREVIGALLDVMPVYSCDAQAAQAAVAIRHQLGTIGRPIGMAGFLIAGICVANNLKLYTGNRKHFEPIDGLVLI